MNRKLLCTALLCITLIGAVSVSQNGKEEKSKKSTHNYILKSYRNTVALYDGGELVETFDEVVLDTLPIGDRKILERGISVTDTEEAVSLIENFDG